METIESLIKGIGIKSIQFGTGSLSSGNSLTIPISMVNPQKTIVILSDAYQGNYTSKVYIRKIESNSLEIYNPSSGSTSQFSYQVLEFK